jgi:hypothetical protein
LVLFEKEFGFFLGGHKNILLCFENASRVPSDGEIAAPTARDENCSEETMLVLFETDGNPPALFRFHRLWFKAPELKAVSVDCRFDRMAGKIVRRSFLGSDRTNLSPRTELIGQLASRRVSCERPQTGICI